MVKVTKTIGKVGRPPGKKTLLKKKPGAASGDATGVIRVNFDISRADHTKLKIYAAKAGCSMADILRAFVSNIKSSNVK
jgi:hypothetical protein